MGPEAYINRYRHAWPAASANILAAMEDAKRRRHRGGIFVPTGTCGLLSVAELRAPLLIPKVEWTRLQVGGWVGGGWAGDLWEERAGWDDGLQRWRRCLHRFLCCVAQTNS